MYQFENSRKKVNAMKEEVFQNGDYADGDADAQHSCFLICVYYSRTNNQRLFLLMHFYTA